jgi:hypothetical protein
MWVPTALFVSCLIALNYILPHGSGTGSTAVANHQKALRIAGSAARHGACPALAGVRGPSCLNLFFAESADSRNLKKQQRVALAAQFILRRT